MHGISEIRTNSEIKVIILSEEHSLFQIIVHDLLSFEDLAKENSYLERPKKFV